MKIIKNLTFLALIFVLTLGLVSCEMTKSDNANQNTKKTIAENVKLDQATLGDVEFDNADTVRINQDENKFVISGTISAMSASQKLTFGVEDVTHVVVLKFTFDKEKTISTFEIKGNTTKVFSTDSNTENYVGSISDLLDSEEGEDAFAYLVLSANTKNYTLKSTYSDRTTSEVIIEIKATLATSTED